MTNIELSVGDDNDVRPSELAEVNQLVQLIIGCTQNMLMHCYEICCKQQQRTKRQTKLQQQQTLFILSYVADRCGARAKSSATLWSNYYR